MTDITSNGIQRKFLPIDGGFGVRDPSNLATLFQLARLPTLRMGGCMRALDKLRYFKNKKKSATLI